MYFNRKWDVSAKTIFFRLTQHFVCLRTLCLSVPSWWSMLVGTSPTDTTVDGHMPNYHRSTDTRPPSDQRRSTVLLLSTGTRRSTGTCLLTGTLRSMDRCRVNEHTRSPTLMFGTGNKVRDHVN